MLKKILGTVKFTASGEKLYPFINGIRESNIACMSQRCNNGTFYGCVYMPDIKRVSDLAGQYGIDLSIVEKKGFPLKLFRYRFRFGIIIGIILITAFVLYISNIVVSIEVCGNNSVTREQIISALSESGIYKGKFIADINFKRCEERLKLSIPEISWAGIRHTGSRIVVDITEIVPTPEMVRDDIPCNIVADRDAQIISMEVYAGKKMVNCGSGVKKGSIIISGIVDDGGGHTLKKHAMGKIIGQYDETVSFSQPFEDSEKVYTGKEDTKKYFEFFGHRLPLFFRSPDYKTYDYSETQNSLMILGKRIPLGIIHTTYVPFEYKNTSYSAEEADILLQQKLAVYEKNFYDTKGIEIKKRSLKKQSFADRMEYNVTYSLIGEIGRDYEIYVDR